jgi:hypothetical protein
MHGHTLYFRNLKSCLFISALAIFVLVTIYATNAFAWGWSRSPGQSSSTPAPSNNTGSDPSNDAVSYESANSAPTNQSLEQNYAATSMQEVQDIDNMANKANADMNIQVTPDTIEKSESDDYNYNSNNPSVLKKRSKRKNMLIKKWRSEFAREDVFYVVTDQPLNIPDLKFQLERIQTEKPEFPKYQLPFEGSDLALLEEWINDSLDRRIPQKLKLKSARSALSSKSKLNAQGVIKKIADLETKREILVYSNKALQAMGIFVD